MNRKKCYCSNKFCKCLFGCGCTVYGSGYGKCMCCIMEENDKKLRRKGGNVTIQKTEIFNQEECKCDDKYKTKFYDIIVFKDDDYWSCRYGCLVTISGDYSEPTENKWKDDAIEEDDPYKSNVEITYATQNVDNSKDDVNILIVKEQNLNHVWCKVNGQPKVSSN